MVYLCGNNWRYPHRLPRRIFCPDLIGYPKLGQDACFGSEIQFLCKDKCSVVIRRQNAGPDIKCLESECLSALQQSFLGGTRLSARGALKKDLNIPLFKAYLSSLRLQPLVSCSKSKSKPIIFFEGNTMKSAQISSGHPFQVDILL